MTTDDVEKYFGNAEKVAEFFGISSEAVYQWRNRPGRLIPKGRAAEAAYRTDGKLFSNRRCIASLKNKKFDRNHRDKG